MAQRIRKYLSLAVLAVILAATIAGGSADAKKTFQQKLDDATIGSAQVDDGSLTGIDVQDNSLTGTDIDESTLVCQGPGGIPGCGGQGNPPAGFQSLAFGSPGTASFGSGQVANNGSPITSQATSTCPAGTQVIGGDVSWDNEAANDAIYIQESRRSGNGWLGKGAVDENSNRTLRVVAICIQ